MDSPEAALFWSAVGNQYDTLTEFTEEEQFKWVGWEGPSWFFLLDGQGQLDAQLDPIVTTDWIILEDPKVYINEASLTIEEEIRHNKPNGGETLVSGTTYTINWTDFGGQAIIN